MTTLIVHESMFGNTRAIAEAFITDLPGHVEVVDVTDAPTPLVVARRGLGRVVAVESFYVEDVSGPLLEGELERARAWARSLVPVAPPR